MASPGFPAAGPGWESPQGRGCAGALPHQLPPRSLGFPLAFYLKRRPVEHGLFPKKKNKKENTKNKLLLSP